MNSETLDMIKKVYYATAFCYPYKILHIDKDLIGDNLSVFDLIIRPTKSVYSRYPQEHSVIPIQPNSNPVVPLMEKGIILTQGKPEESLCPVCPKAFECIDKNIDFLDRECEWYGKSGIDFYKAYNKSISEEFNKHRYLFHKFVSPINKKDRQLGPNITNLIHQLFVYSLVKEESPDYELLNQVISETLNNTFNLFEYNELNFFENTCVSEIEVFDTNDLNIEQLDDVIWISERSAA